ncbi:FtsX-like permease family protein [Lentzea waywayandensis]|uniref:FtsX-like permease family protein n=1 Tax=Lentzea waywayandensis TaxID=84724 RepID=A0A1I6D2R7_9PSEU|nr:FtsX-like permease family protein [Lentzea waywayandensis]SFQ99661.1 FtsX-like permease family protein [Lentzea waywayandensis]
MQILSVLMGLAGLCALMAVVNSVVIAGTERRREFAVFRVSGLSRPQVVPTAVAQATAVAIIGLVLGCAAAGLAGIGGSVRAAIGVTVVHVPWTHLAVVAAGSVAGRGGDQRYCRVLDGAGAAGLVDHDQGMTCVDHDGVR